MSRSKQKILNQAKDKKNFLKKKKLINMSQDCLAVKFSRQKLGEDLILLSKRVGGDALISRDEILSMFDRLIVCCTLSLFVHLPNDIKLSIIVRVLEQEFNFNFQVYTKWQTTSSQLFFLNAACKCKTLLLGLCSNQKEMDEALILMFGVNAAYITTHFCSTHSLSDAIYAFVKTLLRFQTGFIYLKFHKHGSADTILAEDNKMLDADHTLLYDNSIFGTCVCFVEDGMMRTTKESVKYVADLFLRRVKKHSLDEFSIQFHHCVSYGRSLSYHLSNPKKNTRKVGMLMRGEIRPIWYFFTEPVRYINVTLESLLRG